MKKIKTTQGLAEYLKISTATVFRWRAAGMPYKQVGLRYEYDLDEVVKWLSKQNPKIRALAEVIRNG